MVRPPKLVINYEQNESQTKKRSMTLFFFVLFLKANFIGSCFRINNRNGVHNNTNVNFRNDHWDKFGISCYKFASSKWLLFYFLRSLWQIWRLPPPPHPAEASRFHSLKLKRWCFYCLNSSRVTTYYKLKANLSTECLNLSWFHLHWQRLAVESM